MAQDTDILDRLIWKNGRHADIWIAHRKLIASAVNKMKLRPMKHEDLIGGGRIPMAPLAGKKPGVPIPLPWPWPYPGGLRIPHLHHQGDIYELKRRQWQQFSGAVVADFRTKLGRASNVPFDKLLELSNAVDSLG